MSALNGIGRSAWLVVSPDVHAERWTASTIVILGGRYCLDHAAELVPYLKPGTMVRLVHENGQITGANREGWVYQCT